MARKKRSSVSVSVSRPHLASSHTVALARSVHIHRQQNGRIGSSSTHLLSLKPQNDTGDSGSNVPRDDDETFEIDNEMGVDHGTGSVLQAANATDKGAGEKLPPVSAMS
jgi:hypothetical protein